jgi:cytochrome b561
MPAAAHQRYDTITIAFHWLTAVLVFTLFGTAMAWTYLPRDFGLRWLSGIHVSLGIALAAVIAGRLVWRAVAGRKLPAAGPAAAHFLSKLMHWALYALLVLQVVLGFGIEWVAGNALSFFDLVTIPSPFAENRDLARQLESLHGFVAWTLMTLVAGHSLAALAHRYIGDPVLRRMLPAR